MYHTTGFSRDEILELCSAVVAAGDYDKKVPWPPILGLYRSVVVTLTYMRRNRVQVELAETYEVSQSTISRAIARLIPILKKLLQSNEAYSAKIHDLVDQGLTCEYSIGSPDDHAH